MHGREPPLRAVRVDRERGSGRPHRSGRTSRGTRLPSRPGARVKVGPNLASLGGYGAVAAPGSTLIVGRLEDMDVNRVAGCRCLNAFGIGRRPAIFRPRGFDLDQIINGRLPGTAKDLAHDPIDDDGRAFLGLQGMLRGGHTARHAHKTQRDRGSDHRALGVTHVGFPGSSRAEGKTHTPSLTLPERLLPEAFWPARTCGV